MKIEPGFWTTMVGSFPYLTCTPLCERLLTMLDVPVWPQFPRRIFRESMYVQFATTLPGIVISDVDEKITFDTRADLTTALEAFYEHYLADDLDAFQLNPEFSAGFFSMLEILDKYPGEWIKGQVTGPVSLGLTITDQDMRASIYDETLTDAIVKNLAMNARWQIRKLRALRPGVIIFVDEPYLASFGSAYINLGREQVITMLDEVFTAIHAEAALAGVHCCANTDWSVLLSTKVDILNLDAYGYLENLALYPAELRAFLDRGGVVTWGIVPNDEDVFRKSAQALVDQLLTGFGLISEKAYKRGVDIRPAEFTSRSLLAPSCGLGPATIEIADRVLDVLVQMGEIFKQG